MRVVRGRSYSSVFSLPTDAENVEEEEVEDLAHQDAAGTPPPRLLGTSGTMRRALVPKGPCGRDPVNAPSAGRALLRAPTCEPTWASTPTSVPPMRMALVTPPYSSLS